MHGIFYHTDRPQHHNATLSATWSWVPALLAVDTAASIITAVPILPPDNYYGWPEYYSTYLYSEAYSVEAVAINAVSRPGCAIVDAQGLAVGTYEPSPVMVVPEPN